MSVAINRAGGEEPSRRVTVEKTTRAPASLEDLPDIRREIAGYRTHVRRPGDALETMNEPQLPSPIASSGSQLSEMLGMPHSGSLADHF